MATLTTSWQSIANASFDSGPATIRFYLEAKIGTQNKTNRTTVVYTRLRSAYTEGSGLAGAGYKFTCSYASTVSGSGTWYFANEVITSGSNTVKHNDDGTKSVSLSASAYNKYWNFTKNLSATATLPKIDVIAQMKTATDFNDDEGSNPSITFTNPGNLYIRPYLNFYNKNNTREHQILGSIAKHGTPYDWSLTTQQRNKILENLTGLGTISGEDVKYKVAEGVQTFTSSSSSSLISNSANSIDKIFIIKNAKPTLNGITYEEQNEDVVSLLGTDEASTVIAGVSKIRTTVDFTLKKNATVGSFSIIPKGDATSVNYEEDYSVPEGDNTSLQYTISVKDSRGFELGDTATKTVIPYYKVKQNSFSFKRVNPTSPDVRLLVDSFYYQTTFGTYDNEYKIEYKIGDGNWITIPNTILDENDEEIDNPAITIDNQEHSLTVDYTIDDAISYRDGAVFSVRVSDLLSSWENSNKIDRGIPVFEFGNDEVQVNGDLLLADINRENVINVRDALGGGGGTTDYSLLSNKPQINNITLSGNKSLSDLGINIPTQTSQLTNNSGFITNSVNNLTNYTKTSDLGAVALSNDYDDLSNKPTIPSKTSDLTNDSGFISGITSNDVTTALGYTPEEEIDIIDVTSWAKSTMIDVFNHVQNGKLFRLREVTSVRTYYYDPIYFRVESNKITLDYIENSNAIVRIEITYDGVNNPNKITSEIVLQSRITSSNKLDYSLLDNTPTIPTSTSQLTNDSGYITSSYHDSSKQDTLISGTNIKTINNTSILGSGNINIGGGGTATDVKINGTSITSGGEADILTNGTYSSSNKIATMSDIPTIPSNVSAFNNDAGYLTSYTETDPVFSASAASGITSSDITNWNNSKPVSLYNNNSGSQSTITLSDNVSNYSYLEIFFGWNSGSYGLQTVRVDLSKSYSANLSQIVYNNNYLYIATSRWTAGTNKLTLSGGEYWRIGTSGNATRTTTQQIAIYRVLGYK